MQAAHINELETENAGLRERVAQLDERTNTLSKEIVRAKFRGQQQVMALSSTQLPCNFVRVIIISSSS